MKNKKEIRFHSVPEDIELRAGDDLPDGTIGRIGGMAAVYDSETDLGYFREVLRPGAFTRSIGGSMDVRGLWNHDTSLILGRESAGTLRLFDDERGLRFELDLPDTSTGRDAKVSIARRDITGMSFGFSVAEEEWNTRGDVKLREILDLELFEISPVTFPAYADTQVAQRSLDAFQAMRAGNQTRRQMQARRLRMRQSEILRRINQKQK